MVAAALLSSLLLASPAAAVRGCGGHEMNTGCGHAKRQVTNEDAVKNCVWYADPVRDSITAQFPTLWNLTTDILPGDTEAQALFQKIESELNQKFPNIKPHGTRDAVFDGVTYDQAADPDCWWTKTRCTTPKSDTGLPADITTLPEPETWGLGIDDGPNCTNTVLYDFFKQQNPPQKASLYYIGSNVLNWPKQARRAVDDGHQICVHTWSHPAMTSRTNSQAFAELYYTRLVIQKILGRTPLCWRPPYGDVDNRIRFIAESLNLTLHLWSDDTFDWQVGNGKTMQDITNNYNAVINKAKNGEYATHGPIVLNHEVNNETMSEIINQYPNIKGAFKYIVPIASGLNVTTPYAESNITYPTFAELTGNSEGASNASSGSSGSSGSTSNGSGNSSSGTNSASPSGTASAEKGKSSGSSATFIASSSAVIVGVALSLLL